MELGKLFFQFPDPVLLLRVSGRSFSSGLEATSCTSSCAPSIILFLILELVIEELLHPIVVLKSPSLLLLAQLFLESCYAKFQLTDFASSIA